MISGEHRSFIPVDDPLGLLLAPGLQVVRRPPAHRSPLAPGAVVPLLQLLPSLNVLASVDPLSLLLLLLGPLARCAVGALVGVVGRDVGAVVPLLQLLPSLDVLAPLLGAIPGEVSGVPVVVGVVPGGPPVEGVAAAVGPVSAFQVLGIGGLSIVPL